MQYLYNLYLFIFKGYLYESIKCTFVKVFSQKEEEKFNKFTRKDVLPECFTPT